MIDAGWSDWDLEVYCHPHPWTVVRVVTAQEEHGNGRRLIRARFTLRLTSYGRLLAWGAVFAAVSAWFLGPRAMVACAVALLTCLWMWGRGTRQAAQVVGVFDRVAEQLGWITLIEVTERRRILEVLSAPGQIIAERLFRYRRFPRTRGRE